MLNASYMQNILIFMCLCCGVYDMGFISLLIGLVFSVCTCMNMLGVVYDAFVLPIVYCFI